jgi:hypothetical protein
MRTHAFALMACLAIAHLAAAASEPNQSWDNLLAKLRACDVLVLGMGGFGATNETPLLYKTIIATGDRRRFDDMLKDDLPVVRCIGMTAIAQTAGRDAVDVLRERLSDANSTLCESGCLGGVISVGEFAFKLIADPHRLDPQSHQKVPLLSQSELIALELEILAGDTALSVQDEAAIRLSHALRDKILSFDLISLRRLAPALKDYQIVKAIGRMERTDAQQDFLISCLHDNELDSSDRLAAASAVTRHTDEKTLEAIQSERGKLNQMGGRPWGDLFLQTIEARRIHEKCMLAVSAKKTWPKGERVPDEIARIFQTDQPFAFYYLSSPPANLAEAPGMGEAWMKAIVAMSGNLGESSQPWNTYSDTVPKMARFAFILRSWKKESPDEAPVTIAQCDEIDKNVQKVLKDE